MTKTVKKVKQTCTCKNCGNEAEMVITCTLDAPHGHAEPSVDAQPKDKDATQRVKGTGTCTHCGNEADMWVDL